MGRDPSRAARRATYIMMGLAYWVCEIAAHPDGVVHPFGIGFGIFVFLFAATVSRWVPSPKRDRNRLPWKTSLALAAIFALPLIAEPLLRQVTDNGRPLELQLVSGLRNLGFGLCACAVWPICLRLSGVVALFLALFASAMGDQPQIPLALGLLALAGGVWLVLVYQATHAESGTVGLSAGVIERVSLRFPARELIVFGVLAMLAVGVAVAGPKRVMFALGELFPTSGGTGDYDPFARYGTGDGKDEISGDNAKAAGMVESEKMIEDNKDALIDVVNDMYGPPHKPPKEQERTVASGKADIIENHGKLAQNKRPSRDFDTARKGKPLGKKPGSQDARGIIEVEGRTPLHIRVAVYDQYEAGRWVEAPKPGSRRFETEAEGSDWMRLFHLKQADWYGKDERHALKVAELETNLVPTPSMLTRFTIHRVNRPDYYEWSFEGVLVLGGRKKTPSGVIVRTDSRTLDPRNLTDNTLIRETGPLRVYTEMPDDLKAALEPLAQSWVGDLPTGWPQVEAILARLRSEYVLDPEASAPKDHPDPVRWFLFESRRGPDYLFASAASLLLRSRDYSSRFCLGYYARPDAYDSDSQHTPVRQSDLHAWPELLLRDGHWMVVEPTPGFTAISPRQSWGEWISERFAALASWAVRNVVGVVIFTALLAFGIVRRRSLLDRIMTLTWWLFPGRTWKERTLRTVRLLERRARLAGRPRGEAETLARWGNRLDYFHPGGNELSHLIRYGDWAAYGPDLPPVPASEIETLCRRTLRTWTLRRLQSCANGEGATG